MLTFYPSIRSPRNPEPILLWGLPDGTRCMFASCGGVIELQLVNDEDTLLRRAYFVDFSPAYEAAQQWRSDYRLCGDAWIPDADPGRQH
jgi:hypothetical protein